MGEYGAVDRGRSDRTTASLRSESNPRTLSRRELVASTAGLAALAGCLDDAGTGDDSNGDPVNDSPPFDIQTVDAPGSDAGTRQIPQEGQVMLVNFARTQCPTSEGFLSNIGEARADLEDTTVEFVTVVDGSSGPQPTPAELADWWVEHGGSWTVGIDERGALNDYYDVRGFPVVVAIDGAGEVHWRNEGGTSASNVVSGVERALEAEGESRGSEEEQEDQDGADDQETG